MYWHPEAVARAAEETGLRATVGAPLFDGGNPNGLGALREGGFNGWVSYEMCSPLVGGGSRDRLTTCARRFLDYMSRHA